MAIKPEKPVPTVQEMKRKAYERKQKAIEKAAAERAKARRLATTSSKAPTMRDNSKDVVNKASAKAKANALKAANKTPKGKADITKGELYKARNAKEIKARSGMKKVPNMGGRGRMRMGSGGTGGYFNINDMNK